MNFLEVYYDTLHRFGKEVAEQVLHQVKDSAIKMISSLSDALIMEAGRLKVTYKISLADAIALAEAKIQRASLVTCDHHEFDALDQAGEASLLWIR